MLLSTLSFCTNLFNRRNLLNQREFREATQAWSSALGITERVLGGPNHTDVAACMTNLAVSHMNLGDIGPAPEALLLKALSVFEHDQMVFLDQNEHEEFQPFKTKRPEPIASVNTIIGHLVRTPFSSLLSSNTNPHSYLSNHSILPHLHPPTQPHISISNVETMRRLPRNIRELWTCMKQEQSMAFSLCLLFNNWAC